MTETLAQIPPPAVSAVEPVIRFDRSQRLLFDDPARVIVVNWHRQKGKDFTAAAKAVDHALRTGQSWYIVALTQAQADETFNKCKAVAEIFKRLLKVQGRIEEDGEAFTDRDKEIDQSFQCTARILRLPGGGKVVSLPGKNPDTLAGRTGNMILTEFGLYPKGGYEHWKILFPITTRGGFKLIAISTPRGKNTKFYELFSNPESFYSVHFCDIRTSVYQDGYQLFDAQGNPFDQSTDAAKESALATFRKIYGDEGGWQREYECLFTGDLSALIKWAELERAGTLGVTLPFLLRRYDDRVDGALDFMNVFGVDVRYVREWGSRFSIGWDVARRGHLSALWINELRGSSPAALRFLILMHNLPFGVMKAIVRLAMELPHAVGYGDQTGLGMQVNEELNEHYRDRWTPFTFTAPGKRELASALKTGFGDGMQAIPSVTGEHKFVAMDLYAIQADTTGASLLLAESANPTLPESHCDIAYACALSRLAAASHSTAPLPPPRLRKWVGW